MRGTNHPTHKKIYRVTRAGIELFAQRQPVRDPQESRLSNFYALESPDVSGDGRVFAFTGVRDSYAGSFCVQRDRREGTVLDGAGAALSNLGTVQLSRNGRYALFFGAFFRAALLLDRQSGAAAEVEALRIYTGLPAGALSRRQAITSDGRIIFSRPGGEVRYRLAFWDADGVRDLPASGPGTYPIANPAGTVVIYESYPAQGTRRRLIAMDPASGKETLLATDPESVAIDGDRLWEGPQFGAVIDNSGARVLFLSRASVSEPRQVFLVNTDGSGQRKLIEVAEGVREATVSGLGNVAYVVTEHNRLLRIDLATGETSEPIGRTPSISQVTGAPVPGSLNRIRGSGFTAQAAAGSFPLPESLGGVEVMLGSRRMPLLAVTPNEILFQIPWDFLADARGPVTVAAADSVFDNPSRERPDMPAQPLFERLAGSPEPGYGEAPVVVHGNFEALVTRDTPARPGQLIHTYMTGLGYVDPPVATGMPAPADPPARAVGEVACVFWAGEAVHAEVLWAGLAPGFIGVYQVSLRVPETLTVSTNNVSFRCGLRNERGSVDGESAAMAFAPR